MQVYNERQLRELARKRVEFRTHLVVYLIINGVLWLIWFLTGQGYIWPVWPTAGWGIGLIFHFVFEYRSSRIFSEEAEFEKLRKKFGEQQN